MSGVFTSAVFNSNVYLTDGAIPVDTHDGGHWIDYHKRQQEKQRKKLKKQYSKIKSDAAIGEIIVPFVESPALAQELSDYATINIELLYENKIALAQLISAVESALLTERIKRERQEDDNLLILVAQLI